jgi:beta-galactosidase
MKEQTVHIRLIACRTLCLLKRICLCAALLLVVLGPLRGQTRACTSQVVSLDRNWEFSLADAISDAPPDDARWVAVDLPHDWAIHGPRAATNPSGGAGGFAPMGIGWYRRVIETPAVGCARKAMVQFDGVMAHSDVWLNGHPLGSRPDGYVSLQYDLTPYLAPQPGSKNILLVRADNSNQPSSRFYQGAGIYRHARLLLLPPVHTATWSTFITTPAIKPDDALVQVATVLVNDGPSPTAAVVHVSIQEEPIGQREPGRRTVAEASAKAPVIAPGESAPVTLALHVRAPRLWDIAAPHMYRARIEVQDQTGGRDLEQVPFGIREAHFDALTGFWLNGKNIKIKGVALHSDMGALGMAVPVSLIVHRLKAMQRMGANAVRTAHNPVDPEFLDACDQLGLLVLDEFFDVWTVGKNPYDYHLVFRDWYLRDLEDTVQRDRNHPSIIAWSAGNEIHDTPHPEIAKPILESMVHAYHALDPTRPVTQALFRPNVSHDYDDGLADLLDLIGQNYRPNEILAAHDAKPSRKILGTENIHDRATWLAVRDHPAYSGMFVWAGTDYLGESRKWPLFADAEGLFDRTAYPKPDALEHESWWQSMPAIFVLRRTAVTPMAPTDPGYELEQYRPRPTKFHDWTPADQTPHVEHVEVYSNCENARLSLNGEDLGAKTLPDDLAPRTWEVPYAAGKLTATCVDHPTVRDELRTAGAAAAIRLALETPGAGMSYDGMALVRATVVDAKGTPVPGAEIPLRFSVAGAGEMVATDDADTTYHEPFENPNRVTQDGRAVAYVERNAHGALTLNVEAPGLRPASLLIPEPASEIPHRRRE